MKDAKQMKDKAAKKSTKTDAKQDKKQMKAELKDVKKFGAGSKIKVKVKAVSDTPGKAKDMIKRQSEPNPSTTEILCLKN